MNNYNSDDFFQLKISKLTPQEQNDYFIPILKKKLKQIDDTDFHLTKD